MSTEQITQQALALPPEEREKLALLLWHSIDHSTPEEIEQAWIEEAERRLDDYLSGKSKAIDGDTVLRKMRERVNLQ